MRTSLVVVDDFLERPDKVRSEALRLSYAPNLAGYRGQRSEAPALAPYREAFEKLLGRPITKWDHEVNGAFQWAGAEDLVVYHCDTQSYAGVLYLTPDAPPDCGTSFFRSRVTGALRDPGSLSELANIFSRGHFDRTAFEEVDRVGNVFNRLVLWDAKLLHAASGYFGSTLETARLFQLFFFDAEG